MPLANLDFCVAFEEMFLLQNVPDLPLHSASLDLESLYQEFLNDSLMDTPSNTQSTQGIAPNSPPSHTPDPSSLPPQATPPVDGRTILCVVCSAQTSLPPPMPSPQVATLPPPSWYRVPQNPYEYGQRQSTFTPSKRIFFSINGHPGVNVGDALRKKLTGVDGRDDPVLQDASSVISCWLWVCLS